MKERRDSMSIEENVQIVKGFFAAIGSGDNERVLALVAEDIEWIVPGEDWPLAGTHRAHAGVEEVLQKASEEIEMTYPKPPDSWRKETGFLSSASLLGKSRQRISRSKINLSSTSPFGMAN
jgi:ketosteroid isomerase-like protein